MHAMKHKSLLLNGTVQKSLLLPIKWLKTIEFPPF